MMYDTGIRRGSIAQQQQEEEEVRTLLIPEEEVETGSKANYGMVYLSTIVAVSGSFAFGSCLGYSSPTETTIRKDLSMTMAEYSLFGSILTFGAMVGAITSGFLADFIGRKGALRVASPFCALGWLAIFFAEGPTTLDVGRFATGYGTGVFSCVVPVFIAEIAPHNIRGALTATNELMICTAVSVSFLIGMVLSWRALALMGLIPCVILFFGLFLIPESPRWLAKTGNKKGFEVALRKLRGKDADISKEAAEILDYIETIENLPKASVLDLFQRKYLRSLIIGVGLMVAQQLGGINGVVFYASSIFEMTGFPSTNGILTLAGLQVVVNISVGALFIEKAGRKPLLLVSASGMIFGCLLTALSLYFTTYQIAHKAAPALGVTGILVYLCSSEIGMGPVSWVVMSEIFPMNVKEVAGSLATLVFWFCSWGVSYTFNFLVSWSSYGTFLVYAGVNVLSLLFVINVVPETKGATLEQIQAAINA